MTCFFPCRQVHHDVHIPSHPLDPWQQTPCGNFCALNNTDRHHHDCCNGYHNPIDNKVFHQYLHHNSGHFQNHHRNEPCNTDHHQNYLGHHSHHNLRTAAHQRVHRCSNNVFPSWSPDDHSNHVLLQEHFFWMYSFF